MKKTILSLAALMMLMAAPFMTSCSNDLDEVASTEEVKENVVTITLNVEQQAETRVGVDGDLKLTGWVAGEKVMLYSCGMTNKFHESINGEGVEFECTDASAGTFSGSLPTGKTLNDYNLVVYGGTATIRQDDIYEVEALTIVPNKYVSTDINEMVLLAGYFDGTSANLKIVNNVIKINNTSGSAIEAAGYFEYDGYLKGYADFICWATGDTFESRRIEGGYASRIHYAIPTGVSYVYLCPLFSLEDAITLRTSDRINLLPLKGHSPQNAVGKIYTATVSELVPPVDVTGITLNQSSLNLAVGTNYQLTTTVAPDNATDKSVKWTSNNPDVAVVTSGGLVIARIAGNATITATAEDGSGVTATCNVTVTGAEFMKMGPAFSYNNESKTATASNADVTVTLTLSCSDGEINWDFMGNISPTGMTTYGTMTITVTPNTGVTVSGITLKGESGDVNQVTKTSTGPWQFRVGFVGTIWDDGDHLGYLKSVIVDYTKE